MKVTIDENGIVTVNFNDEVDEDWVSIEPPHIDNEDDFENKTDSRKMMEWIFNTGCRLNSEVTGSGRERIWALSWLDNNKHNVQLFNPHDEDPDYCAIHQFVWHKAGCKHRFEERE